MATLPDLQIRAPQPGYENAADRVVRVPRATGRAATIALIAKLSFRAQPALGSALALAAGIALTRLVWLTPAWMILAGLLPLTVLCWFARKQRIVLLPLFAWWLLLGATTGELERQPDPQTELIARADGVEHTIVGEVVRFGAVRQLESQRPFSNERKREEQLVVQLAVRSVDGVATTGGMRLALYAPMDTQIAPVRCGDRMTIDTVLKQPQRYRDPGVWDGRAWLLGQGVSVLGAAQAVHTLLPVHASRGSPLCRIHALQVKASSRLVTLGSSGMKRDRWSLLSWLTLSEADAGMLTAIVTGDRSYLERADRQGFEQTGAFHVLVVSGLHVGLIAALLLAGAGRSGCSRTWSSVITGLLAIAYAVFTGFGAPVQRALAMVLLYVTARALYRERDALQALGVAALCLLAWHPSGLFEAGMQMTILTVVATGGLVAILAERSFKPYLEATRRIDLIALDVGFPPRLAQFRVMLRLLAASCGPLVLPRRYRKRASAWGAGGVRILLRLLELLVMSATVEFVMALPMALYFHRITVLALPVNLLLIPGLMVLLPIAVFTAAVAFLSPHLALLPGVLLALLLHLASGIVRFFAGMEAGNVRVATPSAWAVVVVLAALAGAIWALRQQRWLTVASLAACVVATALLFWPRSISGARPVLEISALDVGQGDALLVVTPSGKTLMVDCGGPTGGEEAQHGNFEIGEDIDSPVLWARGVNRLDAVVLSHAHSDHMGGMFAVLGNFHPRELWVGNNPPTREYNSLLLEAKRLNVSVRTFHTGDTFTYGGMTVRVLAPDADYVPGAEAKNDDSLVLHVAYGQTSALLEGDAEAPSEARMALLPDIHADLLKVGHHGSRTSTTAPFLGAVSPEFGVISVGLHNLYHHPRYETLEHLEDAHVRTYRTDLNGMSTFYLDGEGITASP